MDEQTSHADGDIQTVLGPIPAGELGPFLIHEHLLANLTPKGAFPPNTPRVEITLENVWDIRYQWCGHYGNQIRYSSPRTFATWPGSGATAARGTVTYSETSFQ